MSNDLISRELVLKLVEDIKMNPEIPKNYGTLLDIMREIRKIPAAYDVDKVVERLEEYAHSNICKTHEHGCPYLTNDDVSCENCGAMGAVEIVKSGGIE